MLKDEDDILLAFNSSQAPPLVPGTKQNIYSPQLHMNNAAPKPGAAPTAAGAAAAPGQPTGLPPRPPAPGQQPAPALAAPGAAAVGEAAAPGAAAPAPQDPAAAAAVPGVKEDPGAQPAAAAPGPVAASDGGVKPEGEQGAVKMEVDGAAGGAAGAAAPATAVAVAAPAGADGAKPGSEGGAGPAAAPAAAAPAGTQPMEVDGAAAAAAAAGQDSKPPVHAADAFVCSVPRGDVPAEVMELVSRHAEFLTSAGQLRVRDMMAAMREYLHADTNMAYHLWVLMFPIVWATLEKAQQVALAKPIIALLSKEYHYKQAMLRPNIIQVGMQRVCSEVGSRGSGSGGRVTVAPLQAGRAEAHHDQCVLSVVRFRKSIHNPFPPFTCPQAMLDGIAVSQPQPKIPPELIKFLGKTYNAWQIAIPLLESHVVMFPADTRCFDSLVELYKMVGGHCLAVCVVTWKL